MRRLVVIAALLLLSASAQAQPALTPPIPDPQPTTPVTGERKNPDVAVLLSIGVTTAGFVTLATTDNENLGLLGMGLLYVGPSTGQWYAGQFGGLGLGLRALSVVGMAYGVTQILREDDACGDSTDPDCDPGAHGAATTGGALLVGGAVLWVGSSIYDVVLAKRAADSWNVRHGLTMSPTIVGSSDHRMPGLVLSGRF